MPPCVSSSRSAISPLSSGFSYKRPFLPAMILGLRTVLRWSTGHWQVGRRPNRSLHWNWSDALFLYLSLSELFLRFLNVFFFIKKFLFGQIHRALGSPGPTSCRRVSGSLTRPSFASWILTWYVCLLKFSKLCWLILWHSTPYSSIVLNKDTSEERENRWMSSFTLCLLGSLWDAPTLWLGDYTEAVNWFILN